MEITEKSKKLNVIDNYDVIVCGGGIAGISAALSAKRKGAKVLLLEREYLLGGLATLGLITYYLPICDGVGNFIVNGIGKELFLLSVKNGAEEDIPKNWKDYLLGKNIKKSDRAGCRAVCRFNPYIFGIETEKLLVNEGVDVLYGTVVVGAKKFRNKISHVIVENKSGRSAYGAKAFIDCTGDGDLAFFSGAECCENREGNIIASWYTKTCDGTNNILTLGYSDVNTNGENALNVKRKYSGLNAKENTEFIIDSHNIIYDNFLSGGKCCANHSLSSIAQIPQVRMTRKIIGKIILDIYENKKYSDSVGIFPDWKKKGPVYELPLRALVSKNIKNLFFAGRNISVDDKSWDITRVIPVCAVSGEAVGIASGLYSKEGKISVKKIQKVLRERKVKLHF